MNKDKTFYVLFIILIDNIFLKNEWLCNEIHVTYMKIMCHTSIKA